MWTAEQLDYGQVIRRFLGERSPDHEVRRVMATAEGYDPAVWTALASQLGLQGLAIPEAYGGSGYSFAELAVAAEQIGATLLCGPFLSTVVLAGTVLAEAGGEVAEEYLPGIVRGTTVATVAVVEQAEHWDEQGVTATAIGKGNSFRLYGRKPFVLDGVSADLILVAARTDAGVGVFAVDCPAPGVTRDVQSALDQTRKLAVITFDGAPGRLVGEDGAGWTLIGPALDRAAIAMAAEGVGGARRVLDMSVAYAKLREQFNRPIGSFQAIRHACADLLVEVEAARSIVEYAAREAAAPGPESNVPALASMTKAFCSDTYTRAATTNIQIHGAIGFTWEHPAHLYYKRARGDALWAGSPTRHRERFAQLIEV